jgi:predicted SprT family Zn-dependent metalloprotease
MKLTEAETKIKKLLKEYNLNDWSFKFDNAIRRLGYCLWKKNGIFVKTISLSKTMTEKRTDDEVINTMLHEIAHAIDYETRGTSAHDDIWREIAIRIGCTGDRLTKVSKDIMNETYKWLAICPEHGILGGYLRKPKGNKICAKCRTRIGIIKNETKCL